MLHYQIQDI